MCPSSLITHWKREIGKAALGDVLIPVELRAFVQNRGRGASNSDEWGANMIFIAAYDDVRRHIELLRTISFEVIVVDEAHCLRNSNTALAQAVFRLTGAYRLALSGTPIQNNVSSQFTVQALTIVMNSCCCTQVEDVWSIVHFVLPGYFGESDDDFWRNPLR